MKRAFLGFQTFALVTLLYACAGAESTQSASSWNPQRTWVYFVGLLEWKKKEQFSSFPQKNRRDQILLNVLKQSGVPDNQVVYLKDSEATIAKVRASFPEFLRRTKAGDTVIVYFCGHGYKSDDNKTTYLATYDVSDKITGWNVDDLTSAIEQNFKGSTAILMADNCYSGALAESVKALKPSNISYAALTSAHFNSFSTANWTFTESLIYAFRGDPYADLNRDGKVTFAELEDGASQNMLFAEEQIAEFAYKGSFDKRGIVAASKPNSLPRIGENVEAYSVDGYYKGFIRDVNGDNYRIRFYGYEESDDEWVPESKIRRASPKQYKVGSSVNIKWVGKWFNGKVLEVKGGSHLVSYDGYDDGYKEWIPSNRIKELNSTKINNFNLAL